VLATPGLGTIRVEAHWHLGHQVRGLWAPDSATKDTVYLAVRLAPHTAPLNCWTLEERLPVLVVFVRENAGWRITDITEDGGACM